MGWVSYLEDSVERLEQGLYRLEVKLREELKEHPLFSELRSYISEARAVQEQLSRLIDFAADPEVRWASKAMECEEELRKARSEIQHLKNELRKLSENLEMQVVQHKEEIDRLREKHEEEISCLKEEHKRDIEERRRKWHQWKKMERRKLKEEKERRRRCDRRINELTQQIKALKDQIREMTKVKS